MPLINERISLASCKVLECGGKDVTILPLSTNFYVEPTARQNFNVVSCKKKDGWLRCKKPSLCWCEAQTSRSLSVENGSRLSNSVNVLSKKLRLLNRDFYSAKNSYSS